VITPTLGQRVDVAARRLTPFALTLVLVLIAAVPWRVPFLSSVAPAVALACVYYWAVFRPDLLPPVAVFAVGIVGDSIGGGPFGLGACVLLLVYGIVRSQRRFLIGKSFLVLWWAFLLITPAAVAAQWAATSLLARAMVDPLPGAFQVLLTVAAFPLLTWLLVRAQRAFLRHA